MFKFVLIASLLVSVAFAAPVSEEINTKITEKNEKIQKNIYIKIYSGFIVSCFEPNLNRVKSERISDALCCDQFRISRSCHT